MIHKGRRITSTASVIITIMMTVLFATVWFLFYNRLTFHTYIDFGGICSVLVWLVLYCRFCKTYRAFKIASNAIWDTSFSQFLSVSFADLILYIFSCISYRRFTNLIPGLITVGVQLLVIIAWTFMTKQLFLHYFKPMDTILLYDSRIDEEQKASARTFASKIQYKYGHLFDFREMYPINEIEDTCDHLMKYKNVFLYEIPIEVRSKIIACCVKNDIRFYITPTIGDVIARGYEVKHFIDKPILASKESYNHRTEYIGKRALDIIFSLLLLTIASPIMLIAAIAVKVEDGGDVFFKQARVTRGGKVFNIVKFRSMVMNAEKDGKPRPAIEGDPRITRVGRFIRKTRIDELPQLFNILAGQMSLVGPRAERVEHVELYTKKIPEFKYRLSVKAGLTGYAQIYGKYNTSAQDKLLLDLLYIEKQSLVVDAKIMFLTIKTVFTSESTEGFTDETSKKINQKSIEEEAEKV